MLTNELVNNLIRQVLEIHMQETGFPFHEVEDSFTVSWLQTDSSWFQTYPKIQAIINARSDKVLSKSDYRFGHYAQGYVFKHLWHRLYILDYFVNTKKHTFHLKGNKKYFILELSGVTTTCEHRQYYISTWKQFGEVFVATEQMKVINRGILKTH